MKRRIVSVLTALVMALSLLPVQALAEDAAVGEPVTEIEEAKQTGEGEEPGDPEEEQEPGEPEEPVREFVQGEAQLTVSTAAMAAGTAAAEVGTAADLTTALSGTAVTVQPSGATTRKVCFSTGAARAVAHRASSRATAARTAAAQRFFAFFKLAPPQKLE